MTSLRQPQHPFDAWITAQGKTREWAADRLQTTNASLSRIINGKQWPGPEFFERVAALTGGGVTAEHFVNPKKRVNQPGSPSKPPNKNVRRPSAREKVPVKVRIDKDILAQAAELGIDLDAFFDDVLRERITQAKIKRWQSEHADVIAWYNEHIEKDGIFGEEWRTF